MRLHDYVCTCGVQKEHITKEGEELPETIPCPNCQKPMKRIITKAAKVIFIGGGWYETEYGSQRHNILPEARKSSVDDDFQASDPETKK